MTPTEQDKELREKISHRFDSVCAEGHQQSCGEYQTAVDDIMQLITDTVNKVLDELEGKVTALPGATPGTPTIYYLELSAIEQVRKEWSNE